MIIRAIRNELASFYSHTATGSILTYGYMIAGSIELLQPEQDISNVSESLSEFVKAVEDTVIDSLDIETASILIKSISVLVEEMIKKQGEGVDVNLI